jgi:hydrogenase expression/formation protein HypE
MLACPIPFTDYPNVLLAHGGGGRLSQQLIQKIFASQFHNTLLDVMHDGAVFAVEGGRMAFTTDSYVVSPRFFPGGDIGALAVYGTVNDLAMCGAAPRYLSAGFIIEEGLPMEELWRVAVSMREAADIARISIVTGDTKVVDRGKGDGLFINTAGVGTIVPGVDIAPANARPGDRIILSGAIAEHGIAILSVREGLAFETDILSDAAPLNHLVQSMLAAAPGIHVLRDPTRGGVASALNEIASSAMLGIEIDETRIPVRDDVRGACEILGLDPLYIANEGKLLAFVREDDAPAVLDAMRAHDVARGARVIGSVVAEHPGLVVMNTAIGGKRIVDMLSGEQLPRIC